MPVSRDTSVERRILAYVKKHGPIVDESGKAVTALREHVAGSGTPASSISGYLARLEQEQRIVRVPSAAERLDPSSQFHGIRMTYVLALPDQPFDMPNITVTKMTKSRAGVQRSAPGTLLGAVVNRYFEWMLDKRAVGNRAYVNWTTPRLEEKKGAVDAQISAAETAAVRVKLIQTRRDIEAELESRKAGSPEDEFIKIAAEYSAQHGIEYETWREMEVPADVLKRAGVQR